MNSTIKNASGNACETVKCLFTTTEITLIMTSAFIIFLTGAIGNLCTAIAVISSKRLRSISNLSTLNLSFANIFLVIFVGPFDFVSIYLISEWVFGLVFCKLFGFLKFAAIVATLLNLLVVSIERFVAICFPFFIKMWKRLFIYAVPLVWLIAAGLSAPELKLKKVMVDYGSNFCYSTVDWESFVTLFNQVFLYGVLLFMIPLQMITICMLKIKGSAIKNNSHAQFVRRRNACYMLFLLMLSCLICWIPLQIATTIYSNNNDYPDFKVVNTIHAVFNLLFYTSTVFHPLIFFFLSPKGKHTLRGIMKKTNKRITSPETSKSNDSSRRRTAYWPFSGISVRGSSVMTKDTAF